MKNKTVANFTMTEDKENKSIKREEKVNDSKRRTFLKKAAWSAPTVIAMGALLKPTKARAGFGGPPSDPGK
jgi:hypothetical protein